MRHCTDTTSPKPLMVGLLAAAAALAAVAVPAQPAGPGGAPDPAEVAALLDPYLARALEEQHIPGLVMVVVGDGKVLYARGHGVASLETRAPVDPDKTVFRAGSISKVVTATAVMQLVERGVLRLDEDVNRHLKSLQVPATFAEPITLEALLTHTSGLGELIYGQHARTEAEWLPLAAYLARRLPSRVRPPGELFSYCDHGVSLAGLVAEEAAGVELAELVEQGIFRPLGMTRSSMSVRPSPAWQPDLAVGYRWDGSRLVPQPLDYVLTTPAAALFTTGSDAARFVLAHLQGGRLGEARILSEASAEEVHRRHFAHHPKLRGRALGFSESLQNGRRAIFHDGAMPGFLSRVYLLPDEGWGFFLSHTGGGLGFKSELTTMLLDHYHPAPPVEPVAAMASGAPGSLERFEGCYREVQGLDRSLLKLAYLTDILRVRVSGDSLALLGDRVVHAEPLTFQSPGTGGRVAFREGPDGSVRYLFVGTGAFERVSWLEAPPAQLGLLAFFCAVFAAALVVAALRLTRPGPGGTTALLRASRLATLAFCLASLVAIGGIAAYFSVARDNYFLFMRSEVLPLRACLVLALLSVPLAAATLAGTALVWRRRLGTRLERWLELPLVLAVAGYLVFIVYWRILGFQY